MELDDLKARWQKNPEYQSRLKEKNKEQIQTILEQKTAGSMVSETKKQEVRILRLLLGILLYLLLSPFMPWLLAGEGPFFTIPTQLGQLLPNLILIILGIAVISFYGIKYTSMETIIPGENLRLALLESIKKQRNARKQEIYFCLVLCMGIVIACQSATQFLGYGDFWNVFRREALIALLVGILLIGYYLFRKARHYQEHIRELQQYLSEFDENLTPSEVSLASRPTRQQE